MRLPTEAEWEYAARAVSSARSGPLAAVAWYVDNSDSKTHDVSQKEPNGVGLYHTLGNVWEWVADWYDEKYYQSSPTKDPRGATSGRTRVVRGGSWGSASRFARVSFRGEIPPERGVNAGFRCAGDLP
jgi:formylglycine-generating enzyme required for sulfatase activity